MAGYSGTPLPKKLGIKPGSRVALLGAPEGFGLGPLPDAVTLGEPPADVVVAFAADADALADAWDRARPDMPSAGALWVAFRKRAALERLGITSDLDENVVRRFGLGRGLVDVKVCAIDDEWSGLKFVIRLADR